MEDLPQETAVFGPSRPIDRNDLDVPAVYVENEKHEDNESDEYQ